MAADAVALATTIGDGARRPYPAFAAGGVLGRVPREQRRGHRPCGVSPSSSSLALPANIVAPHSPIEQFRDAVRTPPVWEAGGSWRFALGTDGDGRDMLSRLIYGARVSLFIGLSVMSVSFVLGVRARPRQRDGGTGRRCRDHPR